MTEQIPCIGLISGPTPGFAFPDPDLTTDHWLRYPLFTPFLEPFSMRPAKALVA